jgi:16S rRNA processing protein RimM
VPAGEAAPLRKGQYFHHQIIGLGVWTAEGDELGSVEEILETGANDVYLVRRADGGEVLLPAIRDVIQEIDIEHGRMVVRLIPGLL